MLAKRNVVLHTPPDTHGATDTGEAPAIWAEAHLQHHLLVSIQCLHQAPVTAAPEPHRLVITATRNRLAVRAPTHTEDATRMSPECLYLSHLINRVDADYLIGATTGQPVPARMPGETGHLPAVPSQHC